MEVIEIPEISLLTVLSNKTLRVYGSGFTDREDGEPVACMVHIRSLGGTDDLIHPIINALNGSIIGTDVDISAITETGDYEFWITDQFLGDSNKFAFIIPATNTPYLNGILPPLGLRQGPFQPGKMTNALCPTCGHWMRDEVDETGVRLWHCTNTNHPGTKPDAI